MLADFPNHPAGQALIKYARHQESIGNSSLGICLECGEEYSVHETASRVHCQSCEEDAIYSVFQICIIFRTAVIPDVFVSTPAHRELMNRLRESI